MSASGTQQTVKTHGPRQNPIARSGLSKRALLFLYPPRQSGSGFRAAKKLNGFQSRFISMNDYHTPRLFCFPRIFFGAYALVC